MLRFILRKIINKKWMFIALLIGNILLTGIAASNPIYADAVMQRMLTDDLSEYLTLKNTYPGTVSMQFSGSAQRNARLISIDELAKGMPEKFGVGAIKEIRHVYTSLAANTPIVERDDARNASIMLGAISDFEEHIKITAGRMYSGERREDGVVEVLVSQRGLIEQNLLLGERRVFDRLTDASDTPITIEVVGVFDVKDADDPYWVRTPSSYKTECIMPESVFMSLFEFEKARIAINCTWYELLDYTAMRSDEAQSMYAAALEYDEYDKDNTFITINMHFMNILKVHLQMKRKVTVTLWVLQAPIFALLAAFIFMVSKQILETEESEIAVLKSRGVNRRQIMSIYFIQSTLLALIAVGVGIPLGTLLTQVLGSANAFLEFVSRRALPAEVDRTAILYACAAALVSVGAMTLPVIRASRLSIVIQKQKRHKPKLPLWQKAFLDVVALGVSLYGLYTFNAQKGMIAQRILAGEVPDPLLFLSSSLFIIGAGLLAIRLLPLIISAVFHIFKRLWSPAMYASFLKVLRQRANQNFIMIFLVMTIALGVFNAETARTINVNAEENARYLTGADLAVKEVWENNSSQVEDDPTLDLIYYEPDFGVYQTMEEVAACCKVLRQTNVTMSVKGGSLKGVTLMAIHTKDFGQTAWFDSSLLNHHINEYLNAMAQNARAVILSTNFKTEYGFKLGDAITYKSADGSGARGIVYGFVDYWPGFAPSSYQRGSDGIYRETQNFLIVANLFQVQDAFGVLPYEVWMKTKRDANFLYDYAEATGTKYSTFLDVDAQIVEDKNDPMLKSLNGVLTVGFIVVLMLCFIGFLMYWILSIKQRTLQFGIFRAMGMSMGEIFKMLVNEQFCISVLSILAGAGIGTLAARLYMPLIQMAYASSDYALGLRFASGGADTIRLLIIVGVMMVILMAILSAIIRRMKIAQALKLGED